MGGCGGMFTYSSFPSRIFYTEIQVLSTINTVAIGIHTTEQRIKKAVDPKKKLGTVYHYERHFSPC